jgi:hypothetical protein
MPLHAVQLGREVPEMRHFDLGGVDSRLLEPAGDGFTDQRHDVLVFFAPIAGEISLEST